MTRKVVIAAALLFTTLASQAQKDVVFTKKFLQNLHNTHDLDLSACEVKKRAFACSFACH